MKTCSYFLCAKKSDLDTNIILIKRDECVEVGKVDCLHELEHGNVTCNVSVNQ